MIDMKYRKEGIALLMVVLFIGTIFSPAIAAAPTLEVQQQSLEMKTLGETAPVNTTVDEYGESTVVIYGKCDEVRNLGLWWVFGLYVPIIPRRITVTAVGGQGESVSAFIAAEDDWGMYILENEIEITLQGAKGIFFWGGKARFMENMTEPPLVTIYANARSVQVSRTVV